MLFVSRRLVDSVVKNDSSSKAKWSPEHVQGKAAGECLDFYFYFFFFLVCDKHSLFLMYETSLQYCCKMFLNERSL